MRPGDPALISYSISDELEKRNKKHPEKLIDEYFAFQVLVIIQNGLSFSELIK